MAMNMLIISNENKHENINAAGRFRTRGHTAERFISAAVYDHCYQAGSYINRLWFNRNYEFLLENHLNANIQDVSEIKCTVKGGREII
jgi:hypothetical protein